MKIYLACPYTPPKTWFWKIFGFLWRWRHTRKVTQIAAELMQAGHLVFSPLSHSHPISKYCTVGPCSHDFWMRQDLWILEFCEELWILCLRGWDCSKGIKRETEEAKKLGKEVRYIYLCKKGLSN